MDCRREVVAAVFVRDGRFLAAQRGAHAKLAGLWEFPGGKVEDGESRETALAREMREELGVEIDVVSSDPVASVDWDYDHVRVRLIALRAEIVSGTPRTLDHDSLRWVTAHELLNLPLVPADRPIAERLAALLQNGDDPDLGGE